MSNNNGGESKKDRSTVTSLRKEARQLRHDLEEAISEEETLLNYLEQLNGDAWSALHLSRSKCVPLHLYLRKSSSADRKFDAFSNSDLSTKGVNGSRKGQEERGLSFAEYIEMDMATKLNNIRAGLMMEKDQATPPVRPGAKESVCDNDSGI